MLIELRIGLLLVGGQDEYLDTAFEDEEETKSVLIALLVKIIAPIRLSNIGKKHQLQNKL